MRAPRSMELIRRNATEAPLSSAQESLWFIEQAHPGTAAYNVPLLLRWNEAIDLPALRHALLRVITRHEALRTAYRLRDGRPFQLVLPPRPAEIAVHRSGVRPGPAELAARGRLPFDLTTGRPLRCDLWQGAPDGDTLLLTLHHIAFDGWSLAILLDNLHEGYEAALIPGAADETPEPVVQYADFAHWERASWTLRDVESRATVRAGELAEAGDSPLFPGAATRGAEARPGGHLEFPVSAGLWERTAALATRLRATPFVVLFAAFQEVLRRWSDASDFLVGTVMANRPKRCLEGAVGCFVNTVPLRCRPAAGQTFEELCREVRTEAFRAMAHQDLPFDRLTALTAAKRGTGRGPLVEVAFGVQNMPVPRTADRCRWQQPELLPTGTARYDLLFLLEDRPTGVTGTIEYDLALCSPQTAARFRDAFLALLDAAIADPQTRLAALPLSSRMTTPVPGVMVGERRDLGRTEPPADRSLLGLLAARLAENPGAVAVSAGTNRVTRGELDDWSWAVTDAVHAATHSSGAVAGVVPVLAARGPALAAGWLGVLRAGRAYVPLGLDAPVERLEYIFDDLAVDTVLADEAGAELLRRVDTAVRVLDLGALRRGPSGERRASEPDGGDTAVVIYTSGTTGRPKGVPVPHRGLANTVLWWAEDSGLGPADRLLCVVGTSFDPATFETFRALVSGAELVYADDVERRDGRSLLALLRDTTVAAMTPSLLRAVLDVEDANRDGAQVAPGAGTLRMLYLGGEKLTRSLVAQCDARWGVPIRNVYGPTEVSCTSLSAPVDPADPQAPAIGVPVWNTRAYVLGPDGEELPIGVPGELYLAGVGVSDGYLNRTDLTAAAFRTDPFAPADEPGARMYRTGDRAVVRADGMVEYLGRADEQVKILGNRIEPAEVATLLEEQHESVSAAAVTAEGDPASLVAYVVLDPATPTPGHEELVRPLLRWLPAVVLPSAVYPVDALPTTAHDKTDFRALAALRAEPLPWAGRSGAGDPAYRWASDRFLGVLGTEGRTGPGGSDATKLLLGPDDDFFALGGHSLLAVQMLAAVQREDGIALTLGDFLAGPSVAGLTALRDAALARGDAPAARSGETDYVPGEDGRHPATPIQQRMVFLDRIASQRSAYLAPTVVEFTGEVEPKVLAAAVAEVLGHHPALRSRFRLDRASRQVLCTTDARLPEVAVADWSGTDGAELTRRLTEYCWTPFALAEEAPVRGQVLTLDQRVLLVLVIHHIVIDGWAQHLLMRQIGEAYRALAAGRRPVLPAAVHPAELVDHGSTAGGTAERAAALLARLRGAPVDIALPRDRERTTVQDPTADVRSARLSVEASTALRAALATESATTSMAASALLGAVLAAMGDQRDFLFAYPWVGRATATETEAVAMLIKTLLLRVDLRDSPTWRGLLGRVRQESLAGYRYADVPFETLVAELDPGRGLGRPPVTPVLVTAVMDPPVAPDLGPAAQSRQLPPPGLRIKYEIELTLRDIDECIEFEVAYATALFDASTAETLLSALVSAAGRLAADPDAPVLPPRPEASAHIDRPHAGPETGEAQP